MHTILSLSARDIATRVARRELSAEAVVRAFAEHTAEVEPGIRAWQYFDAELALAQARVIDHGEFFGALCGVPVGVKDLMDTADMPTTYGSPIYAGQRPKVDAACVAAARNAGAIVYGKTVTTEFATFQPGATRNPRSMPEAPRTPGGSSSGSAAAVAAHMVPVALGTQTAASIVRPAAYCGIVGFKPTHGLLPIAGVKSLSPSLDTVGGFARRVDDVAFFLGALSRTNLTPQRPPQVRVGLCRTPHWSQADADAKRVWAEAARSLERRGARLLDVNLPGSWATLAQAQIDIMGYEAVSAFAPEQRQHTYLFSAAFAAVLDTGKQVDGAALAAAHQRVTQARAELALVFDTVDVLIAPSAPSVAPAGLDYTGDPVFGRLWSAVGVPCVHVPCGTGDQGLPLGVTVVAAHWNDAMALGVAEWLEA